MHKKKRRVERGGELRFATVASGVAFAASSPAESKDTAKEAVP